MRSVIVDDRDVRAAAVTPNEANPPLIVDANTMLAGPRSLQELEAICGWNSQVIEPLCGIQHAKFATGDGLNSGREPKRSLAVPNALSFPVGKAADHDDQYNASRYIRSSISGDVRPDADRSHIAFNKRQLVSTEWLHRFRCAPSSYARLSVRTTSMLTLISYSPCRFYTVPIPLRRGIRGRKVGVPARDASRTYRTSE
jgi:hypothetical protein